MRILLIMLALLATTAQAHKGEWWDEPHALGPMWEMALIKADGTLVDLDGNWMLFIDRESCMKDGTYRMQRAIDNQHVKLNDKGAKYTQYLDFVCEEVKK